jgi:hypothetical protein
MGLDRRSGRLDRRSKIAAIAGVRTSNPWKVEEAAANQPNFFEPPLCFSSFLLPFLPLPMSSRCPALSPSISSVFPISPEENFFIILSAFLPLALCDLLTRFFLCSVCFFDFAPRELFDDFLTVPWAMFVMCLDR